MHRTLIVWPSGAGVTHPQNEGGLPPARRAGLREGATAARYGGGGRGRRGGYPPAV